MTQRRKRKRRKSGLPALSAVPPVGMLVLWGTLHEPLRGAGLLFLLFLGMLIGVTVPALLVSLDKVPMLLIPPRKIAAHRQKLINGNIWRAPIPRELQESARIPKRVQRAVFRADRYRCVNCGYLGGQVKGDLHADHIRPWRGGGLTAIWNLMTLCAECNMIKCNYWRDRDGFIHYRYGLDSPNLPKAAAILAREQCIWVRYNPARWVRAGYDLAA